MFYGIWLAVLGILGASNLIISRKPDAKELIAKLAPYQGWIGAISALGGAWIIVSAILNLGMLGRAPIAWITLLANGVGVLKTFIKSPAANERMDQTIAKLAPYQGTLGLIALGLGVWAVICGILFAI
jgi:hypothetical protein